MAHYVTAVRPSGHRALLVQAAAKLDSVKLSSGAEVRAWRTKRVIAGKQRVAVVVFSPQLHAGQLRGLHESIARAQREIEAMGLCPPLTEEAAKRKLKKIVGRQYLRSVLCYQVEKTGQGQVRVNVWSDREGYNRLIKGYFGLRVLITDRAKWSTAQIIEAYRGQSKVEAAFRDLKDPRMFSTRPQFHWTDQKLHVHAFMCVTAYLLVTLLHRHATQKSAFEGSSRRLIEELPEVRCCRLIDVTGRQGRPRVRWQVEESAKDREALAQALDALPTFN